MDLQKYFDQAKGTGVLATADGAGKVDAAIYARPHVFDDQKIAFIMRDRLTHKNLQTNPHAAYLFVEEGEGYEGRRLYLKKTDEEKNTERLESLRRKMCESEKEEIRADRFLVTFQIEKVLPLIGDK